MKKYTLEELLAVEISKIIRDDEMNFTGIGTGARHISAHAASRWWR